MELMRKAERLKYTFPFTYIKFNSLSWGNKTVFFLSIRHSVKKRNFSHLQTGAIKPVDKPKLFSSRCRLDTVAFMRWVTGSGDDVLADNDCCVVPKQTAPHPPTPPPPPRSPATLTLAFLPSFFVWALCWIKFRQKRKIFSFLGFFWFFPHRIFPFFANQPRLFLHLLTSGVHIWNGSWPEKGKKESNKPEDSGKRGHVMTCLQLEAIGLCNFHTSHTVGEPRCAKTNIGKHDKYALWFYSWLHDKFPAVTCGPGGRGRVDR